MVQLRVSSLAILGSVLFSSWAVAEQLALADAGRVEEVTIVGSKDQAREVPGSAYVIDAEDLEVFQYTDINRILSEAPGVYLREEEGLGFRPNIGIRGSGTERSGKITLMEDGVLVAPAPYSNPEAYYFPTAGRMSGIEILKGPTLLKEGPYTVGGAVNMLSTPIPEEYSGKTLVEVGERDLLRVLASYGGSGDTYGWLVETHQYGGQGFQDIDRSDVDAGFRLSDYVAKVRFNTPSGFRGMYQRLDLKVQYSEEQSRSSYLGLTDVDFDDDPNRRYGMTEKDLMKNHHTGVSGRYVIEVSEAVDLHALAYYNSFARDWFKVDKVGGQSLMNLVSDANLGIGSANDILQGGEDVIADESGKDGIDIKHNNREYESRGLQLGLNADFMTGSVGHALLAGVRFHRDEMDRFQPVEIYSQVNGSLVYEDTVEPVGSNNREEDAKALSYWAMDTMSFGERVDLTLVLRREEIETSRTEYADVNRNFLAPESKQRSNTTREWLPGAGITYQFVDSWQMLAGVHRGMSPAGAGAVDGTQPELSTNYEFGFRFAQGSLNGDLIGFYSDYENSLVNCSIANPCENGETSGTEQLGKAEIKGLEATLGYTAYSGSLSWPLRFSYTYTNAEITEDSDDGSVLAGDGYRYIPENVFYARAGVVGTQGWDVFLAARYTDEMCIDFTCDRDGVDTTYKKTDSLWVVDAVSHYRINDSAQVYLKVDNLFDEQKIVSRTPGGARPNRPRTALLGLNLSF